MLYSGDKSDSVVRRNDGVKVKVPRTFSEGNNIIDGSSGFTLIEMAVVLFILGLLIAGVLGPLEVQIEARDRKQTIDTMNEIVESLYGYAITNGRLPCPNTDGDGIEQLDTDENTVDDYEEYSGLALAAIVAAGGVCLTSEGFAPWVTLGVSQSDAWGNRFTYRISSPDYTTVDSDGFCNGGEFDLCATGDIDVQTRGDDPGTGGVTEGKSLLSLATGLPAILVSHGRNGFGAISTSGVPRPDPPASTDEEKNTDDDIDFFSRGYSRGESTCADDENESTALCAFDDIVMWLSPAVLNNRMVTAGRLP